MGMLVVIPIAAAIALLDRKKIEDFFFLAIGILIMCILMAGYACGNTEIGVKLGVGIGIVSTIFCVVIFFKDRTRFWEYVMTPGFFGVIICVIVSGIFLINKTDLGSDYDTYLAHAPQVLNMYRYSDIGNVGTRSATFNLLYSVPVYTSWCYFCNKLWFCYSDGVNLWAWQLFITAALAPFFSYVKRGEVKKIILIAAFLMLIPGMIGFSYGTLYDFMPDIPLGAMIIYGTVMVLKFFRNKDRYNDVWYLLGGCLCLLFSCVLKKLGSVYTFSITGLIVLYTLDRIFSREPRISFLRKTFPFIISVMFASFSFYFIEFRNEYYGLDKMVTLLPFVSFFLFFVIGIYCWIIKSLLHKKKISASDYSFICFLCTCNLYPLACGQICACKALGCGFR